MNDSTPNPIVSQNEEWRDIPDYEGFYQISDKGRIKRMQSRTNTYAGKILKPTLVNKYLSIYLKRPEQKRQCFRVHALVMYAFVGQRPLPDTEINHINGNKRDNRLTNLEWLTRQENMDHARNVLGYSTAGENNPSAKLNASQVTEIRRLAESGIQHWRIAKVYGISRCTVSAIVSRRLWKHVT